MDRSNGSQAARQLATAMANIARGALSGGLPGAAAGAAKSFLPELVKVTVIVICVLLLLPTLIIAALPNIMFGYNSATADDIITLTGQARNIDAAYRSVQNYNQAEIDRIISSLEAAYSGEDGPQYDALSVEQNTENTNIYWFIAITSAAHHQDLYTMSAESIRDMVIRKLSYSANLFSEIIGEGDAAVTMRTLKVDIKDLEPDALMRKLGFTEDEERWARTIYATMAQDQNVDYDDTDGDGYYNTDYGDIVFADAATPVVYYNQTDFRWGSKSYGKTGTIGSGGCGPAALAIAVASLADSTVTPEDVAAWSVNNGYRCEGNGSYHTLITDGGAHYGLTVTPIGRDGEQLVQALKDGKLVIGIYGPGHFTSSGHFIVLRGVTADGNILVADPASVKRSGQSWPLGIILNEVNRAAGAGGPFWVLEL